MLRSLLSAFLMYSRIPVPQVEWKEENRRYSLGFFPLVGAVIGGLFFLWRLLCGNISAGPWIFAAGAVLIPVLVTGGIHLDGFCDVTDAKASYGDREKKLEIMADPHIGSFAVIHLCLYLIIQTILFAHAYALRTAAVISCGYVLSRGLSGMCAVLCRAARKEGTLQSFVRPSHRRATLSMLLFFIIASAAGMAAADLIAGLAALICAALTVIYCRRSAYKSFGGFSGDVCGWFMQLCEISILAAAVISAYI